MVTIKISRVHAPVRTLGWGARLGIWVQGCTIGCHGCVSKDTWDPTAAKPIPMSQLIEWCDRLCRGFKPDGVTITGGEPFEQPSALDELLIQIRNWLGNLGPGERDILVYSGLTERRVFTTYGDIARRADALICGPYNERRPWGGPLCGSDNQTLATNSDLGASRYSLDATEKPLMQVAVDETGVWMIGIPKRDGLRQLEQRLANDGIEITNASWRA